MEHLMGCHGEWLIVGQILAALPVVGVFFKTALSWLRKNDGS